MDGKAFLEWWFGRVKGGFAQLTYIRAGRVSTSTYDLSDGFELAWEEAKRRNENAENVYLRTTSIRESLSIGQRGSEEMAAAIPGVWAEIDVAEAGGHKHSDKIAQTWEDALRYIDAIPCKPTVLVKSGGGYHLWWRAVDPWAFQDQDEWYRAKQALVHFEAGLQKLAMVRGFGLDPNITRNLACLLRVPGLVNWKREGGDRVTVEEVRTGYDYDWGTFAEVANSILGDEEPELYTNAPGAALGPRSAPGARGRNDTLKAMLGAMLKDGRRLPEIISELVSYDLRAHDPPLFLDRSEGYAKTRDPYTNALAFSSSIMTSIQRQAEAGGKVPDYGQHRQIQSFGTGGEAIAEDPLSAVPYVSFGDAWLDRSSYDPHLIDQILPKSVINVIAGPPKSQKSYLVLDMACRVARGLPWFGFRPIRPLRVCLLQFELPMDMMRRRVHTFTNRNQGFAPGELALLQENIKYSDRFFCPFNRDNYPHFLNYVRRMFPDPYQPPDVIVFDPLQNMFEGNENDNAQMLVFLHLVMEFVTQINPEGSVVIIHHANKTTRAEMLEDPFNALRGASALRGFYTSCIMAVKLSEEGEERKLFFDMRAGISPHPKVVELQDGEFVETQGSVPIAGETQLESWNAERRRQRNRILYEINMRALRDGNVYALRELSDVLGAVEDLPGSRRVRQLLGEYATRGYIRFVGGDEIGMPELDSRAWGYVVTEITMVPDNRGDFARVKPTHYKDPQTGYRYACSPDTVWRYDDDSFTLAEIDPREHGYRVDLGGDFAIDEGWVELPNPEQLTL